MTQTPAAPRTRVRPSGQSPTPTQLRRVALASSIGSFVEWYDFYIYATAAALIFPQVFFPEFDPLTGTLIGFATFGAGFVARPIGAAVFGHFGDRLGRKSMLIITLLMMGIATTLMGLLPSYDQVGVLAPLLLVALRLVQGFAVGGEYGGAILMATESSPDGKRGRYVGIVQAAVPLALVVSSAIFLLLSGVLSDAAFLAWGWRVPFLLSILMVGIGYYIRSKVDESPVFRDLQQTGEVVALPVLEVFRKHWSSILLIIGSYPAGAVTFFLINTFSITLGVQSGLSKESMLLVTLSASVLMTVLVPVFGALSDRVGRQRMYFLSLIVMAAGAFPLFALLSTGSLPLAMLGYVLPAVGWSMFWGPVAVLYSEIFSAKVRYSGLSIGYMLATLIGGATPPIIATALYARTGSWVPVSIYMLAVFLIGAVSMTILTRRSLRSAASGEPPR